MTMLNGEPVDTGVPSTAPKVTTNPGPASGGRPIKNPIAAILGIAGLVFAITFAPMGLILGIIAKVMAKRAGDRSPFATAAIIVGAVLTVLGIIAFFAFLWFTIASATAGIEFCVNGEGDGEFFGTPITCE